MRAALVAALGNPSTAVKLVKSLPSPVVAAGQVLISVHACGVNYPDVLMVQGRYQMRPPLPFAAGGEVAGLVKSVGAGVRKFKPNDRVIAFCGYGGFATEVAVKQESVYPLPEGMDYVTASGFTVAYQTSYYALKSRAQLKAGETVLVLGAAGGCGLAACQLAKAMGATVIAVASSEEKRRTCLQEGKADYAINYNNASGEASLKQQVRELTKKQGVHVVFDPVGGSVSEECVRCLAQYGRYLVIGFAAGAIPKIPLNLLLLKQASMIGVFMGQWAETSPDEFETLLQELVVWHQQCLIKPLISGVFPLEKTADALVTLQHRKAQGKLVVVTRESETARL